MDKSYDELAQRAIEVDFTGDYVVTRAQLADAITKLRAERDALSALLRECPRMFNNVEVLGEWSGADINLKLQKKVRAELLDLVSRIDAALAGDKT